MNELETLISRMIPADVVYSSIEESIVRKKGFSFIRLGDGEWGLLQSLVENRPVFCVSDTDWMNRILSDSNWKAAATALVNAVTSATIVGLSVKDMRRDSKWEAYKPLHELGVDLEKILWVDWAEVLGQLKLNRETPRFKTMLKNRSVAIVHKNEEMSRKNIEPFGPKAILWIEYYLNKNNSAVVEKLVNERPDIVLMSGGPCGKALCVDCAKRGLVAFDLGRFLYRQLFVRSANY